MAVELNCKSSIVQNGCELEQCGYIKLAVLRGRNVRECHSELVEALGNNTLLYRTSLLQYSYFDVGILF
jgi:hypothetical protein